MNTIQPVLEVDSAERVHGLGAGAVYALRGVSLAVSAGEFVAVMGPSGSGKSTLLNIAGGLDQVTKGAVRVRGKELGRMSRAELARVRRRDIGYVFQNYNLIPSLTAAENVALPLELDGIKTRDAARRALAALEAVGLSGLGGRLPSQMSGGEQQRTAIARAVIGDRGLMLADEPTGALDTHNGAQIGSLLRDKCNEGAAVVLVTHEPAYGGLADRVVHLRDGKIDLLAGRAAMPP
ncbi:MAG: ABC transporter ATP-binding protein [Nocardioides sp.]